MRIACILPCTLVCMFEGFTFSSIGFEVSRVSRICGSRILKFKSFKVSRFPRIKVSEFKGAMVIRVDRFLVFLEFT
jgi:hypothetical protein